MARFYSLAEHIHSPRAPLAACLLALRRLNPLKQFVAFSVKIAAGIFFIFSGQVVWLAALVMSVGALLGGSLGGRVANKVKPQVLGRIVVGVGMGVGILYLLR